MIVDENVLPVGFILKSPFYAYRIEKVLGVGGFGITYLATASVKVGNVPLKVKFAVKEHFMGGDCERENATGSVVFSKPAKERVENSKKDFIAEAKRLQAVGNEHHNIVKVNEVFESNNTAYYIMEYLDGESLRCYVNRKGKLGEEEMLSIMNPVIDAVKYLHNRHMTHLDIKPDNIMLVKDDNGEMRPVLIDFGLSKHYHNNGQPTSTINTLGFSDGYAPIEQYAGITTFSPKADIYSIGATMWFCLTGEDPKRATELRDYELADSLPDYISMSMKDKIRTFTRMSHHNRSWEVEEPQPSMYGGPIPGRFTKPIGPVSSRRKIKKIIIAVVSILVVALTSFLLLRTGCSSHSNSSKESELFKFEENGKYGFKDADGQIVINAIYDYAGAFSECLADVEKDGKWGYIDRNNTPIIPFEYDDALSFFEGLAAVRRVGKYGFIDKNDKTIIPFEYDDAFSFSEGLAPVRKEDKWGYIDKNGETIIPFIYDYAASFNEGKAYVRKGGEEFYINKKGERLSDTGTLTPVSQAGKDENRTVFEKNGKYGFKDGTGNIVIEAIYEDVSDFSEGLASVIKNGKYGFIDKSGNTIIPFEYDFPGSFDEGLACVKKGKKWGFIDKTGNTIIPFEYDDAEIFSEGLAAVNKGGKYGFIDKTDNTVIPFEYDDGLSFSEGLAAVGKGRKWGYIDKNGNIVIPFEYDDVVRFSEGLAAVKRDGKWGFIDKKDKTTIPFEYDYAGIFNEGKAYVQKGSESFYINTKGERLP